MVDVPACDAVYRQIRKDLKALGTAIAALPALPGPVELIALDNRLCPALQGTLNLPLTPGFLPLSFLVPGAGRCFYACARSFASYASHRC